MPRPTYPHLFSPIRIGTVELANRICHVPTDISSANADGSVNQRVITYHEQVAKGDCGFIIVGASTPDRATGRPTVTCLSVDEDPMIPGLAQLAEACTATAPSVRCRSSIPVGRPRGRAPTSCLPATSWSRRPDRLATKWSTRKRSPKEKRSGR